MSIFYSDSRGEAAKIDVWKMDGTKAYLRHYSNYLVLDFISKASKDNAERAQARKEMEICQRKLSFWKKHPRYEHDEALRGSERLKAEWKKR